MRAGAERAHADRFGDTCTAGPRQVEGTNVGLCPWASTQLGMFLQVLKLPWAGKRASCAVKLEGER